jgi:ubiquinone/menaquinone biosynthesis C-methylase UbiE
MSDNTNNNQANETGKANEAAATAMCCAQFYEQDIVQELMGGSYHPGGENLSATLVKKLNLPTSSDTLDVACGVGTTTRIMAFEFGFSATGLDFGKVNVEKAVALTTEAITEATNSVENQAEQASAQSCCAPGDPCCTPNDSSAGLAQLGGSSVSAGSANFIQGSADALPFTQNRFDGVTCECAVSTFADQQKVAEEFFRVLKPGGVFGMTDMVLNSDLPAEFAEKVAPWTCMAKALTIRGYQELFESAGFILMSEEDHSHSLLELAKDMKRKLVMAGMGKAMGALPSLGMSFSEMRSMLAEATDFVKSGSIQYRLLVFKKPQP